MKTKKSLWSIVLSLILVLALALSIGLGIQKSTVNAQNDEHITFNVLVDDEAYKSVSSTYSGEFTVSYYVTESTGVDALQLKLGYNHEKFTLVSVVTNDETALGAATKGVENHLDNVVYDNTNNNGAVLVLNSEDESILLITAVFEVKEGVTLVQGAEYEFGFYNVNDTEEEDTYSTAWRIEKDTVNPENPSTHEKVEIIFANVAKIITKASIRPILTGIERNYNGQYAQNSEITINLANAYQNFSEIEQYDLIPEEMRPGIAEIAWFEAYETEYNNYVRYRKLTGTPKDAGTYYVAIRTSANDYFEAYCGWALEDQELFGEGAYGLDAWAVGNWSGVATYVINPLAITITMNNQTSAYGDAIVSPLTYTQTGTVVEGENLHFLPSTTATSSSDVGTYPITMGHDNNSNYIVTVINGDYTITKKAITITALPQNAQYTGSEPTVDQTRYSVAPNIQITGVVITKEAGVNPGTYVLTPSFDNDNYNVTTVNGVFTITTTALSQQEVDELVAQFAQFYAVDNGTENLLEIVNKVGSYSRTYNGNPVYIGVVLGNSVKLSGNVEYRVNGGNYATHEAVLASFENYAKTNAGEYIVEINFLPGNGYAFAQGVNSTYTITLTIVKKAITITADDKTSEYGTNPVALTPTTAGINGEVAVSFTVEDNGTPITLSSTTNVGTYDIVPHASHANYTITVVNGTYTVTKTNPVITVTANNVDYNRALDYTVTVTVAGQTINAYTVAVNNVDLPLAVVLNAGEHILTVNVPAGANYNAGSKSTGFTVNKIALATPTFTYDHATATWTAVVADNGGVALVNGTEVAYTINGNAKTNYTYTATTNEALKLRVYSTNNENYLPVEVDLANLYTVTYVPGTYDIEKSGVAPVMPASDLLFAGQTTSRPADVALAHYTFIQFADSDSSDPEDAFDFAQGITGNTNIYVVWEENSKYTITLYYMVEGNAEDLHQVGEVLEYYDDVAIRYNNELPTIQTKDWFKLQTWYLDDELTTKFVDGTKLEDDIVLYANYKFNIGLGDVNADGIVGANDITLYRRWIVGGYTMIEVEDGEEWATVNGADYNAENIYFVKRVADSNSLSSQSLELGDNCLDIRDVSTIRMAMVGGYGFSIIEGKYVDGEELIVSRTIQANNASDLLTIAKSGVVAQLSNDITEENFVGAIVNAKKNVTIDLNGHTLKLKSLSIALAANNEGKIEIKNGSIYVANGNGVALLAPKGSVVLDNVTLYDKDGEFTIQAADHSLHFVRNVEFLKDNNGEEVPAQVKVEKETHVVVEENKHLSMAMPSVLSIQFS